MKANRKKTTDFLKKLFSFTFLFVFLFSGIARYTSRMGDMASKREIPASSKHITSIHANASKWLITEESESEEENQSEVAPDFVVPAATDLFSFHHKTDVLHVVNTNVAKTIPLYDLFCNWRFHISSATL